MDRLFLLLPVVVAALWFLQRYREGAFSRRRRSAGPAAAQADLSDETGWVYRPEDFGLVPDDKVDTEKAGPDPELNRALDAASSGDWRPAAILLANSDLEWRWRRLISLAKSAAEDDAWVRAWRTAYPGDPAAALVSAQSLVELAWKVRGAKRAHATTQEQFEGFHRVLAQAPGAFREAARLAPADPCPYIGMILVATGLGWPHEHMNPLWGEVVRRAPYHVGAHAVALQYWCAKWQGSSESMHAFAESAAAQAPAGSLLTILRLQAIYEELIGERSDHPRYQSAETTAAIDVLLADVEAAPPGHAWLPAARHLLVWFLRAQRRLLEAARQLHMVDGYIGAIPWRYSSNPLGFYTATRQHLVLAERRLLRESAGGG
jgi:hypothetical protein